MAEIPPLKIETGKVKRFDSTTDSIQIKSLGIGTDAPATGLTLVDGTQGASKILTSDASGNASWQTASTSLYGTEYASAESLGQSFNATITPVTKVSLLYTHVGVMKISWFYNWFLDNPSLGFNSFRAQIVASSSGTMLMTHTQAASLAFDNVPQEFQASGFATFPDGGLTENFNLQFYQEGSIGSPTAIISNARLEIIRVA